MANKKVIIGLLKTVKRTGMYKLIQYIVESDYFEAPASTRYHANYEGGLAQHSWHVYSLFKQKNQQFKLGLSNESIILCSFLHDLCKVGTYSHKTLKNGEKASIPYSFSESLPIGHSVKSLHLINKFIELTDIESLIIRWHMSWSDYEFKKHIDCAKEIAPAIMAFICADIEASSYLDDKNE